MARSRVTVNRRAPFDDPEVWDNIERIAGKIAADANQTSAMIGITHTTVGSGTDKRVIVGPKTAAGGGKIPVEFGTWFMAGKQFVKRALDRAEVRVR